jgi:hypothetical protein
MSDKNEYKSPDKYDRMFGSLTGRADVTRCKPTTVQVHTPLIGAAQTFIIQTMRAHDEQGGDTVFVQYVDDTGAVRLYLPPAVADAIARQRDALTTKNRKRVGKEAAQARKARGELPAFMKGRKAKKA